MSNPDRVLESFIEQAEACESLGSPFTGGLCRLLAENLNHKTAIGKLCLDWPGNPHPSADSVPLRLCGGLHALALSGQDAALAEAYAPPFDNDPNWSTIEAAMIAHVAFLTEWMKSPPQTNEVSRSGVLWPAMMAIAKKHNKPLRLMEVGASAGLNLRLDHFAYTLGELDCGASSSALHLTPEWRGETPDFEHVSVASREGCDLNPLDPTDEHAALRLRSYCWADQTDRKQRLDAALKIAKENPAELDRADAIQWLKEKLADPVADQCTVVYSTIAWQYIPDAARAEGERVIRDAGARANADAPLCWLRFEADGQTPGGRIQVNSWPSDVHAELGRGDFHGRWVNWKNPVW